MNWDIYGSYTTSYRLDGGYEQCSNHLQLNLYCTFVNFTCEIGPAMTKYDFVEARRGQDIISLLVFFLSIQFWIGVASYGSLDAGGEILSKVGSFEHNLSFG